MFVVAAVLFDLDGTLVDSTESVERAWHRVADELGVPVAEFVPYMHGIPAAQVFARVVPSLPADEVAALTARCSPSRPRTPPASSPHPAR